MSDHDHLEELSDAACLALLRTVPVGRVGISVDALPVILPVNFVLDDRAVLFRTVPGTKLHAAMAQVVVAFEADHYDASSHEAWSVLVRGVAEEITDPERRTEADGLVPRSWAFGEGADHLVRVPITVLSGRRLRSVP
ncbi:MAG: pyridoxamine 5'-phosphate oxidase family protein [Acidimicrobiales bacterium]|nr:pyridoxamine 5'-phosphate oxidase family protein [Acidimicrobiales bacterium]